MSIRRTMELLGNSIATSSELGTQGGIAHLHDDLIWAKRCDNFDQKSTIYLSAFLSSRPMNETQ
jgi:hypothetical protein